MLINLGHPLINIIKGFLIGNGIRQDNAMCTLIIGLGNILIPFLASSIPNLKLKPMVIYSYSFNLEVNSDGGNIVCFELIVAESDENVGFADTAITDYDEFQ
jgi:hypothetical protein